MDRALDEADGRHPSNDPLVLRDPAVKGLTLRISGHSAGWYLKVGKPNYRLAGVGKPGTRTESRELGYLYTTTDAKAFADEVREVIDESDDRDEEKLKKKVRDYIAARHRGASHADALGKAESILAAERGAWNYETLVRKYVDLVVSKPGKTAKGKIRPAKAKSVADVERYLMHPATTHMHGRLIRDITKGDIGRARNLAYETGKKHPQRKIVTYVSTALSWASEMHGGESGMDGIDPWWIRVKAYLWAAAIDNHASSVTVAANKYATSALVLRSTCFTS